MNNERLRRIMIRVIGVTMLLMVISFVVYLSIGYLSNDPAVNRLLAPLISVGSFIFYFAWRILWLRQFRRRRRGGFLQGYRRKYDDGE